MQKKNQAYVLIKNAIMECKILPGEVLNMNELSEWLGVSRTPLREALSSLETEGFIKTIPHRGAFVCDITPSEVREKLEVRELLETYATRLATPNIPEKDLDFLCEKIDSYFKENKSDPAAMLEIDLSLHGLIVEHCGNETIKGFLRNIADNIIRMRIRSTNIEERLMQSTREHEEILKALKERDASKAEELMRAHIRQAKANALKALQIPITKRN